MIAILRKLSIIILLFAVFIFIQFIQVESTALVNPKTLVVLGFLILASFTLGEILSFIKLPKVIGYLLIGIIFGPYSAALLGINLLEVLSIDVIKELSLVVSVTLSIIALTAGMELKINGIKELLKPITLILLFKSILIFILVTAVVYALAPFIPFLMHADAAYKIAAGLIISVVALGTSIELILVVQNETKAKGRFIDLILSTAIVKDVLVILLLALVLTISSAMIYPQGKIEGGIFLDLGLELLYSIIFGSALGGLTILYLKYVHKELLLYILALVVFGSELSTNFHLETLVVFVAAGFVVENFSKYGKDLHQPLQKLSLPIFITFFTVVGASINFLSIQNMILIGLAVFIIRGAALYFSINLAAKISKENLSIQKNAWLGFLPIGGLMLGLSIVISQKLPGLGEQLKDLITTVVALNLFLGPILLKIGINRDKKLPEIAEEEIEEIPTEESKVVSAKAQNKIALKKKIAEIKSKFAEPDFADTELNRSLFGILFKIYQILKDFDKKFIYFRSEESLELLISFTEKYTDEYVRLKSFLTKSNVTSSQIKDEILNTKKTLSDWIIQLCDERKTGEKNIVALEPLIKELFISLVDLTDGLQTKMFVNLEPEFYEKNEDDNLRAKIAKFSARFSIRFNKLLNKKYIPQREINYRNLTRYYLVGESSGEILETVNLVGNERLTTLRKIRALYTDILKYLEELTEIAVAEKDNIAVSTLLLARFDELHNQFVNEINIYQTEINETTSEISTRLKYALANPFNKLIATLKVAGTFKYNKSDFRFSKVFNESEIQKENALQTIRYWINYYLGFLGLFEKEAYTNKIKVQLNQLVNKSLVNISDEINFSLRSVSNELNKNITEFKKNIKNIKLNDIQTLKDYLGAARNLIFIDTIRKYSYSLDEILKSKKMNLLIENLITDFSKVSKQLPEKLLLLEETDLHFEERLPEFKELRSVPLKEIAHSFLEKKLPREIGEINELLINHLNITLSELNNFPTIVNFHINTAVKELENNDETGFEIALELANSLSEKLQERLGQLNQQIDRLEQNVNKKITEKVNIIINQINELIIDSSLRQVNLFVGKEATKQRFIKSLGKQQNKVNGFIKLYFALIKRNYNLYFKSFVTSALVNFKLIKPKQTEYLTEDAYLNQEKLQNLPFIYRKLFDGTPLESNDFFIGQEELSTKINSALKDFSINKSSSIIIIGEPGSGKKSLINTILTNSLKDKEVLQYQFKDTISDKDDLLKIFSELLGYNRIISFDELLVYFNDKSRKKIIVLENINKLFINQINGFSALKNFIYLVSMTNRNVFWLCSIGKHSWNFLKHNFEMESAFKYKIVTEDLHKKDIKSIILSRHGATGYSLKFLPSEMRQFSKKIFKVKSEKEEQEKLSSEFFKKLEEYSEGNIISAMYYWLQSIDSVKGNLITIKPPRKLVLGILNNIDPVYLLTIATILIHGWITAKEHAKIYNIPLEKSREILNYLASLNLIYHDQFEMYSYKYFLNKFVFRSVEKELIKRNIF